MGIADAILDLVSSGTTLKENNLKEIEGGVVLESQVIFKSLHRIILWPLIVPEHFLYKFQAALVASRRALTDRKGALKTVHEILERLEAHLKADGQFTVRALFLWWCFLFPAFTFFSLNTFIFQVVANMRGNNAQEVAERVLSQPSLSGLQVNVMKWLNFLTLSFLYFSLTVYNESRDQQ